MTNWVDNMHLWPAGTVLHAWTCPLADPKLFHTKLLETAPDKGTTQNADGQFFILWHASMSSFPIPIEYDAVG